MAPARSFLAPLSRTTVPFTSSVRPSIPQLAFAPLEQLSKRWILRGTKIENKKKKANKNFTNYDLREIEQFSLIDAMHYIRAFEVGRNPTSSKYDLAVRFRTQRSGPVVRNRLRLPHPVKTDIRICVIAPPDSKVADDARAAGASLVGEDEIFAQVKEGVVNFDRCICHIDSLQKLNKAQLGRILGPKGLMPSTKLGTVVSNVAQAVRNMVGGSEYRERDAVVRLAIGQLGFAPEAMQANIKAFMESLRKDIGQMSSEKEVHEVVLSSTNAPGFTLNGEYRGPNSISPKELSGPL
ncbi:50S ribosomal protein L1 [Bimuria novae-zelandiae CBS 107.79]|uniref:50S ribosomal protein L1 n=1 Tax=Bimuria novae-zelandiae CBS 107.79 TaxID=1447943 RepID=A0A6A5URG3_9PLEO|nr:50S ribosomal protein L1 [Bimuria novae-zelandiae CBS 107.79]